MQYAYIVGDENTAYDPIMFVYDNGKYEVICQSHQRQKDFYDYLQSAKPQSFEDFLSTFSYFNVDSGEVTDEIESVLNKLRAQFGLMQVAEQQTAIEKARKERINPADAVILRLSQRMRTGANEN